MATKLFVGLGTVHRTHDDAVAGRNPLTQDEVDAITAADLAERDRIQAARLPLACPACGRMGERKLPTRGPRGEADVLICATLACYHQWNQKRTYLNSR